MSTVITITITIAKIQSFMLKQKYMSASCRHLTYVILVGSLIVDVKLRYWQCVKTLPRLNTLPSTWVRHIHRTNKHYKCIVSFITLVFSSVTAHYMILLVIHTPIKLRYNMESSVIKVLYILRHQSFMWIPSYITFIWKH